MGNTKTGDGLDSAFGSQFANPRLEETLYQKEARSSHPAYDERRDSCQQSPLSCPTSGNPHCNL